MHKMMQQWTPSRSASRLPRPRDPWLHAPDCCPGDPATPTATRERAAIVLLVLAWGTTFAAVKIGLESSPPILFAGSALPARWSGHGGARLEPDRDVRELAGQGRDYTLLTALNVLLFFGLQTVAIGLLPSGLAAVLIYLQPVLVGLLAWWLLGEPMTTAKILGLVARVRGHRGRQRRGVRRARLGRRRWRSPSRARSPGRSARSSSRRRDGRIDPWWAVALPFLVGGALLTVVGLVVEGPDITWSPRFVVGAGLRRARRHGSRLVALVRPGRRRRGRPRGVVHLLRAAGRRRGRSGPAGRDPDRLAARGGGAGRAGRPSRAPPPARASYNHGHNPPVPRAVGQACGTGRSATSVRPPPTGSVAG